jgi:hypothetical protein
MCCRRLVQRHRPDATLTAACVRHQNGDWKRTKYVGTSLVEKTLAVIGFGKVCCRRTARCMSLYRSR